MSYDRTLPAQHSYLGSDLQELKGRVMVEDNQLIKIPLLSLPGVVLVPGQTLPLQMQHPSLVAMMRKIIDNERMFGLTSSSSSNVENLCLGTTAEIRSYGFDDDDGEGLAILTLKAEGILRRLEFNRVI